MDANQMPIPSTNVSNPSFDVKTPQHVDVDDNRCETTNEGIVPMDENGAMEHESLSVQNVALRQNFDHLKKLYLKLSQANSELRETCRRLHVEKSKMHETQRLNMSPTISMHYDKGNDIAAKEIEALRYERDQVIAEKESLELEYVNLLALKEEDKLYIQRARELAHKCKRLEIDLETAIISGDATQEQLVKMSYEKDMVIMELEKSRKKLEENFHIMEEEKQMEQSSWANEKCELLKLVDDIERDKENYKRTCQTLESQVTDLRIVVSALETSTQDAEARHTNAFKMVQKDNKLLEDDLEVVRKEWKASKESVCQLQKEIVELRTEASGLRSQLQDALNESRQHHEKALDYIHSNKQMQENLVAAHTNIAELIKARQSDEEHHINHLKECQASWDTEKQRILNDKNAYAEDKIAKALKHNHILKKRLKQSYHVLASMTSSYNGLRIHLLETKGKTNSQSKVKFPKQVSLTHGQSHDSTIIQDENLNSSSSTQPSSRTQLTDDLPPLDLDMTQLAKRQMKLLAMLSTT